MPPATSVSSVKVTFSLTPASSSAIFFASARRKNEVVSLDDAAVLGVHLVGILLLRGVEL